MMTMGVKTKVTENFDFAKFVVDSLARHMQCDWGDLCDEDKQENEFSFDKHLRLFSAYENDTEKIWIITEADRSVTTVLYPDEY